MKFEGGKNSPPGEFASKALVCIEKLVADRPGRICLGWWLSEKYFFSLEEAKSAFPNKQVKWPVEKYDDSFVYVPAPEELK